MVENNNKLINLCETDLPFDLRFMTYQKTKPAFTTNRIMHATAIPRITNKGISPFSTNSAGKGSSPLIIQKK